MAFEPVFRCVKLDNQRKLCSCQAVVEARLMVTSGSEIAKILSISPTSAVTLSEVFTGEARFNGKVNFKVLYVSKLGENCALDYNAEFMDKVTSDLIVSGLKAKATSIILDTDIVSITESEIKLAAVVEVSVEGVFSETCNMLVEGGANVYTHDDRVDYSKFLGECTESVAATDTMVKLPGKKILLLEPKIVVEKREVSIDTVTVSGRIISDIIVEADGGMIECVKAETAFCKDLMISGARRGDVAITLTKAVTVAATIEGDGAEPSVKLEYSFSISTSVFSDEVVNPIIDAFMIEKELMKSGIGLSVFRNCPTETYFGTVEGNVALDINLDPPDNILAITGKRLNITRAVYGEGGTILVEGIVHSNVIYYCAEKNSKNSLEVELPFSHTFGADMTENMIFTASGVVVDATAKIKRGNEISIKAEIAAEISASEQSIKYVISELKEGEEIPAPTGAFSIHISKKGETLWNVSRSLSSTPELILLQNPGLVMPLVGGERVICYRHLRK